MSTLNWTHSLTCPFHKLSTFHPCTCHLCKRKHNGTADAFTNDRETALPCKLTRHINKWLIAVNRVALYLANINDEKNKHNALTTFTLDSWVISHHQWCVDSLTHHTLDLDTIGDHCVAKKTCYILSHASVTTLFLLPRANINRTRLALHYSSPLCESCQTWRHHLARCTRSQLNYKLKGIIS